MKTTTHVRWLRGRLATGFAVALLIAACGGSGGGDNSSSSSTPTGTTPTPTPTAQANTLPVVIDAGPAALTATGNIAANILYASVTVCSPGSTTACRVVDHVQVDTGSTGLRLIASALGAAVPTPTADPTTSLPLRECVRFADGYSWGSVGTADVTLGSRTITSLPVHVIGDPAAGSAPASCVSGPQESDVVAFGANGILGVGNFLQDCGSACVTRAVPASYYVCPATGGCTPVAVALTRQVPNPVSRLATDNNGVVIQLPAVASPGATNVAGTVVFGIGTQADNALGNARVLKLTSSGTFTTTAGGASFANSFIDSGSNANFFPANIATCADAPFFFCPVTSSGVATSVTQSAVINGTNGVSATVTFTVDNADQLFRTSDTAYPGLAGPNGSLLNGTGGGYDFGLPFFYGRSVYVVIEGNTVGGVTGPAVAF